VFNKKRRHSVNRPPTPDAGDEHDKELTLQERINIKVTTPPLEKLIFLVIILLGIC